MSSHLEHDINSEDEAPPSFTEVANGFNFREENIATSARVTDNGRIAISLNEKTGKVAAHFQSAVQRQSQIDDSQPPSYEDAWVQPASTAAVATGVLPPALNIVIQVVGSRGDIQPFIAIGRALQQEWKHRVRIATHPAFEDFVEEHGLEFFSIGGDPAKLMAFMVKHPGLVPGFDAVAKGEISERRKEIFTMLEGCWRSCIEAAESSKINSKPFVADVIIANPPSFAHIHCAQKLGIPLHVMFTMPWSPTQQFPHPLVNVEESNMQPGMLNYMSYVLVERMIWQGVGDLINKFRTKVLNMEPLSHASGPAALTKARVPHTYCWSPSLIPKPKDWGHLQSIAGFYFLKAPTDYVPEEALSKFLASGPEPIYVGFGSIVVDYPHALTSVVMEAVKRTGRRAVINQGWGGLGIGSALNSEDILLLGNVPHEWLFRHVSCAVHHGGAGTTAAAITSGIPSVIVPFFGDQPFWGNIVSQAGAGPAPIPRDKLSAERLAHAILEALQPGTVQRAHFLRDKIALENGIETGISLFHRSVNLAALQCPLSGGVAVWRIKNTSLRVSALSAALLLQKEFIKPSELKLCRHKKYNLETGSGDPVTASVAASFGGAASILRGFAEIGTEATKAARARNKKNASLDSEAGLVASRNDKQLGESTSAMPAAGADMSAAMPSTSSPRSPHAPMPLLPHDSKTSMEGDPEDVAFDAPVPIATPEMKVTDGLAKADADAVKEGSIKSSMSSTSRGLRVAGSAAKGAGVGLMKGSSKAILHAATTPFDVVAATARGLHNAPRLYGDDTVREQDRITGLGSGLKAAGKGFGLGVYDGVTGLVTQPIRGAKKDGPAGFAKGFVKGALGIGFKPTAAFMGLLSNTYEGMNKEVQKIGRTNVKDYIHGSRLAQGFDELQRASSQEQDRIVSLWHAFEKENKSRVKGKGKAVG